MKTSYATKQTRGSEVKGFTKVTRAQVRALFENGQTFNGFIAGNKVSKNHYFGGWHLSYSFTAYTQNGFNDTCISFMLNLEKQLGNDIVIYVENKKD